MFNPISKSLHRLYARMDLAPARDRDDCDLETAPFDDELFTVIDGVPVTFREFNARLRDEMREGSAANPAVEPVPLRKAV